MSDVFYKTITLASIEDVKRFIAVVSDAPYDMDLVSGRYVVDAKSIMGIFSLDLSKPLNLRIHAEDPGALLEDIAQFELK